MQQPATASTKASITRWEDLRWTEKRKSLSVSDIQKNSGGAGGPGATGRIVQNKANSPRAISTITSSREKGYGRKAAPIPAEKQSQFERPRRATLSLAAGTYMLSLDDGSGS
jgi:hypothetical protein